MKKIILILLVLGFIGQAFAQNLKTINQSQYKTDMETILQYINDNDLAICSKNYIFVGVYSDNSGNKVCSVFSGDWDLIHEHKILSSKIYYVAGLRKCSENDFNEDSTTYSRIDLGKGKTVRYYNFAGAVNCENRNLVHYQTTDILNPPDMNATYKTMEVIYDNIYFPEAYEESTKANGITYEDSVDDEEEAKKSMKTLFNNFAKIEAEYSRL